MKTITKTVAATAALLLGTVSAQADDDKRFDGAYIGAEAGFNNFGGTNGNSGLYYGGVLGYRVQSDSGLVLGVEGRFGGTSVDRGFSVNGTNFEGEVGRHIGGDVHLGYAVSDSSLLYALVGYDNIRIGVDNAQDTNIGNVKINSIRFGGGYEYAFSDKLSVRFTGMYSEDKEFQGLGGILFKF